MEDIIDDQSELLEELQRLRTENRALKSSRLQASFDFRRGDRGLDGESSVLYIKSLDGRYLQVNRRFEENWFFMMESYTAISLKKFL